jgi:hypothetical protein
LFALLFQLVLSFGHVHAGPTGSAATSVAADRHDRLCALPDGDRDDGDHADGHCAICATIRLLGCGWVASPPAPLVRRVSHAAPPPDRAATTPTQSRAVGFRSRAPPLA